MVKIKFKKRAGPKRRMNFLGISMIKRKPMPKIKGYSNLRFADSVTIPRPISVSLFSPSMNRPATSFYGDIDRDGVMNAFDCQPNNKHKQRLALGRMNYPRSKPRRKGESEVLYADRMKKLYLDEHGAEPPDYDEHFRAMVYNKGPKHAIKVYGNVDPDREIIEEVWKEKNKSRKSKKPKTNEWVEQIISEDELEESEFQKEHAHLVKDMKEDMSKAGKDPNEYDKASPSKRRKMEADWMEE